MKIIYLLFSAGICLGLLFSPVWAEQQEASAKKTPEQKVQSRQLQREMYFFLHTDYKSRYKIFSSESGELKENFLQEDAHYKAGQTLVILKNDAIHMQYLEAAAELSKAKQELQSTRIGFKRGQNTAVQVQVIEERTSILRQKYALAKEAYEALTIKTSKQGRVLRMASKLYHAQDQNITFIEKHEFIAEFVKDASIILKGSISLSQRDIESKKHNAFVEVEGKRIPVKILSLRQEDTSNAASVHIELETPDLPEFTQGDIGVSYPIFLQMPTHHAALSVPRAYIYYKGNLRYCIILRAGKMEEVPVMTGEFDTQYVEVFGDIQPGDVVMRKENF